MSPLAEQLNYLLAIATIGSQIGIIILIGLFIFERLSGRKTFTLDFFSVYAVHFVFFISLAGLVTSLVYSEIIGFIPCGLCWLQRIFLYPQVLISGIALWKRDRGVLDYLMGLSIVGGAVALYQHYLQMGGNPLVPCPAVGPEIDCAQRVVFEFGYITLPLMSFTAFLLIIMMMVIAKLRK